MPGASARRSSPAPHAACATAPSRDCGPQAGPPYGYLLHTDGYLVKDPNTQHVVDEIFSTYLTHSQGPKALARRLNERGIPSPRGGRWHDITVHRILKNPTYAGKILWSGQLYDGRHEPYVSEEALLAIADDLRRRRHYPRNTSEALVAGFAVCGQCGLPIRITHSGPHKGRPYAYYTCPSVVRRYLRIVDRDCGLGRHRVEDVDAQVEQALLSIALDEKALQAELRDRLRSAQGERSALERQIRSLEQQVRDLEARTRRYMEAFEVGDLPAELLKARLAELHDRHEKMSQEISALRGKLLVVPDPEVEFQRLWPLVRDLPGRWHSPNMTLDERRALVRAVFRSLTLLPSGEIHYRFFV